VPAGLAAEIGKGADVVGDELAVPLVVQVLAQEALRGADRQVGDLGAQVLDRLLLLDLDLALPLRQNVLRLLAGLRQELGAQRLALAPAGLEERRGLAPRPRQDFLVPAERLVGFRPGFPGRLERVPDRARMKSRMANVISVQRIVPVSGCSNAFMSALLPARLLQGQHHADDQREERGAFDQRGRDDHRGPDLPQHLRLARAPLHRRRRQLADAGAHADDRETRPYARSEIRQ
jgi:hypothetical protein